MRPRRRQVRVELARQDGAAVVRVTDSGPGPSPQVRQRLFEPFASDKGEGVGLGLFVARQVAAAHGGTIRWERQADATSFIVQLPVERNLFRSSGLKTVPPESEPKHGPPADRG